MTKLVLLAALLMGSAPQAGEDYECRQFAPGSCLMPTGSS
jgi:hypothetical protein